MAWPKDPFITDSAYKTPLPCQPIERELWRLVVRLYEYDTLAALLKLNDAPSASSVSGSRSTGAPEVPAAIPTAAVVSPIGDEGAAPAVVSPVSPVRSPRSTTLRADVVERRGAFLAAASNVGSNSPSFSASGTASPLLTRRGSSETLSSAVLSGRPTTATGAAARTNTSAALPSVTAVPPSQPLSPYPGRGASSSWSNNNSLSGSTGFIRSTSQRAIEPVRAFLADLATQRCVLGAGVVDIAVQHPLPCMRVELVRMLLTYPYWSWAMCAPVAVAAGRGDVEMLQLLMEVQELDPNTGFPLTVAVRQRQEDAVLPFLLSHHRIRVNYGGAFYVAVVVGNVSAMHLLGDAAGVNVNRFANNEGTSALLYALRQYLICRRAEVQLGWLSPPTSTPLLHAAKSPQAVTSPTHVASEDLADAEEEEVTSTPLLVVRGDGRRNNPLAGSGASETSMDAAAAAADDDEGPAALTPPLPAAAAAAAAAANAAHNPHAPRPSLRVPADDTHSAAFRRDTKERPLHSTRHWLDVLLYLLDHPAIEVNAGFYMTPLQICVMAGNAEVVTWLLQHPHLRPSRLPKATTVLCNSYYLLQHHALSQSAMHCVVATPIEMAARLHHLDIFRHLARDQRIQVPVRLTMDLERSAADGEVIPYLTVLAQYREEWEGWGWRWRRRCTFVATISSTVFALCFWAMSLLWPTTLRNGLLVLAGTYGVCTLLSLALLMWHVEVLRHSPESSLTHGRTAALALLRHLCPTWSTLRLRVVLILLVACPGLLPVLDLLCAWCMYRVHRSRRRLRQEEQQPQQTLSSPTDTNPAATSTHAVTPSFVGSALSRSHSLPPRQHQHQQQQQQHQQHQQQQHSRHRRHVSDHGPDLERLSSSASWGWSVGISDASANSSLSEAPMSYLGGGGSGNDSFSRPRPALARSRRQSGATGAAGSVAVPHGGGEGRDVRSASASSPPGGRLLAAAGTASSSTISPGGGYASSMASPSMCTSRHRPPWVVPGRPSRFMLRHEYHAPDLLLRALAYSAYDTVLVLPRLLTCVVGIFMFMYMVFPTAAPSSTSSPAATADALRGHSSFTLYFGTPQPTFTRVRATVAYNITGAALTAAAAESEVELPSYSIAIGFVGLCGLLASILGGAALLAMMGSLRTVTVQAFFTNPGEREDTKGGGGRVEGRTGGDGGWQAARHRAQEAQPNYAL